MFSAYRSRISVIRPLALLFIIVPVLSFFSGLYAAEPITAAAIYTPAPAFLDEVRTKCGGGPDPFDACFLKMLGKAGAAAAAVDFARLIDEPGFMTKFKKVGAVDIAFAELPFRANENSGVYLVNGTPRVVNIDDLSSITGPMLEKDPRYTALKKKYPDIGLFTGDRASEGAVRVERLKGGKLRFTIPYRLTTGCRACEDVGTASVGFDFGRKGEFEGRKLISVRPVK
jgi:hypothetical protein